MADASTRVSIESVNDMSAEDFVVRFGAVLEDSPHLAAAVCARRPFVDEAALVDAFLDAVHSLDPDAALALIRAHPELGARRPMAAASTEEQASAGVTDAEATLRARLADGNEAYRRRFDFPFVVAVRGRTPEQIVDELETRLRHDRDTEFATALDQICVIARLRVEQLMGGR